MNEYGIYFVTVIDKFLNNFTIYQFFLIDYLVSFRKVLNSFSLIVFDKNIEFMKKVVLMLCVLNSSIKFSQFLKPSSKEEIAFEDEEISLLKLSVV